MDDYEQLVSLIGKHHRNQTRVCIYEHALLYKSVLELKELFEYHKIWPKESIIFLQDVQHNSCIHLELIGSKTSLSVTPQGDTKDVILFGFGRIGRAIARILIELGNYPLRLKAIIVRTNSNLKNRMHLFKHDSVHGKFNGTVNLSGNTAFFNDIPVRWIEAETPCTTKYPEDLGLINPIIIDNTGKWRNRDGLDKHTIPIKDLDPKVILTCPSPDLPNIVFGVNHESYVSNQLVSAASCTTNAVVPVLSLVHKHFGIESGHMETVHSYTNDQNLIDNYHKKSRRDRAAALNLVPSSTGASEAAGKCIPELQGKLTSSALRVPIPDVSMAILILNVHENILVEKLESLIEHDPLIGSTRGNPVVSSDVIGLVLPCLIDTEKTIIAEKKIILYVWYDNEIGYSWQTVRLAEKLTN